MAKTVLINGCSYAHQWQPTKWFEGYDIVNIAASGGSNRRAIRTTVEWILKNGNPDYVLLPVTFFNRSESFFDHNLNFADYISISFGFYANHKLGKLFEEVEAVEHPSVTLDRFVTDMIMFDSFLKQRNIPYLAWNMCTPSKGMPSFKVNEALELKMAWLKNNPRIVDWDFVGNVYLGENGARVDNPSEEQWKLEARHYDKNDYYILEKYLNDYR
jgi:hypothetical protein